MNVKGTHEFFFLWLSFDAGHPCDGQLTPGKTMYLLTSITDHIVGSSLEVTEVTFS